MSPAGFKPTIPGSVRPQTHALDCAATGIGRQILMWISQEEWDEWFTPYDTHSWKTGV